MSLERARRRKFTELVANHVFRHINGNKNFPVVNVEVESDKVRRHRRATRPGFNRLVISGFLCRLNLLHERCFDIKAFFD